MELSIRRRIQALSLLEHLVKNGAERVIEDARDHLHRVRMLSDFNYYEGPQDKGAGGTCDLLSWGRVVFGAGRDTAMWAVSCMVSPLVGCKCLPHYVSGSIFVRMCRYCCCAAGFVI